MVPVEYFNISMVHAALKTIYPSGIALELKVVLVFDFLMCSTGNRRSLIKVRAGG